MPHHELRSGVTGHRVKVRFREVGLRALEVVVQCLNRHEQGQTSGVTELLHQGGVVAMRPRSGASTRPQHDGLGQIVILLVASITHGDAQSPLERMPPTTSGTTT